MNVERWLEFLETLLYPLVYIVLICCTFIFIIRPFINYLLLNRQIEQQKKLKKEIEEKIRLEHELKRQKKEGIIFPEDDDDVDEEVKFDNPRKPAGGAEQDKLDKLAKSSPDKAGELVKRWVNEG